MHTMRSTGIVVTISLLLILLAGCAGQSPSARPEPSEPPTDVYLVPVGDFPFEFANQLAHNLSSDLKIQVRASLPMGIGDIRPLPKGPQLAVEDIIARAHEVGMRLPNTNERLLVIALTDQDINDRSQALRFLFAKNDRANRTSVISVARMFASTPQATGSQAQVGLRIYKMVKRAIGEQHFGLPRSSDISDIMYSPIMSLEDIDAMGTDYKR